MILPRAEHDTEHIYEWIRARSPPGDAILVLRIRGPGQPPLASDEMAAGD